MKPTDEAIQAIYEEFLAHVDMRAWAATENMMVSFVTAYGSCSYEELSLYMGMDIHKTHDMVAALRAQGRLAKEGLITI